MAELTRGEALLISAAGVNSLHRVETARPLAPFIFHTGFSGHHEESCSDLMISFSVL